MRPGIDPKVDYAFKRLFGREQNLPLLVHLLNALLQPPPGARIIDLELLNPFNEKVGLDDKLSIVDVKARDQSGRLFHVEMQVLPEQSFRGRVLYYWARLHQQQLHTGDLYGQLRPTVSVCFTDFVLFPQVPEHCLVFELLNRAQGLVFSPDLRMVTVELPKFTRSAAELTGALDVWLYFLRHAEEMDTEALPAALNTPEIHLAMEELTVLSQNDLERERYEARVKLQRDELSRLHSARTEGQLIGAIHVCEDLLQRARTPEDQLLAEPIERLEQLVQQLKQELRR